MIVTRPPADESRTPEDPAEIIPERQNVQTDPLNGERLGRAGTVTTTRFALRNIKPNPFRNIGRYPIRRDKVDALRESIRTTGFWSNIVGRAIDGEAEIAYGHNRIVALLEEYGPNFSVDLIIKDLSDEQMLQIIAAENSEDWATNAAVDLQTIRAAVEVFAAGRVRLPPPLANAPQSTVRYAPSFVLGGTDVPRARGGAYNAASIARFLGWTKPNGDPQDKVRNALAALELIERGLSAETGFDGLTSKHLGAVVTQVRRPTRTQSGGPTMRAVKLNFKEPGPSPLKPRRRRRRRISTRRCVRLKR